MIPFLCAFLATSAVAEEPSVDVVSGLDASGAESFADDLVRRGDPFNALTFYRLSGHLSGTPEPSIAFRTALCYELGERFSAAEESYLDLAGRFPDWSARATWRAAMSARHDGRFGEAALHLSDVSLEGQGTELATRAQFMQGVLALDQVELERADQSFEQFVLTHPDHAMAPRAVAARSVLADRVPRRSPVLAGILSAVIPGSGQLYAGHPGDAAMAFLSSGVLGLWSYTLVRSGVEDQQGWRVGTGTALGTVAAFTWTSNVFGSVRGAKRSNSYLRRGRAQSALRETADPSLEEHGEDVLRDEHLFD
ncbi:MAG: hypothetical protein KC912_12615 [Proteobacteria bacterium]|nr:hypothetical protein [Pseudomonadota bacterium]